MSGMKERVGDGKLISLITSVSVRAGSNRSNRSSQRSRVSGVTGEVRKFARYHGIACKY